MIEISVYLAIKLLPIVNYDRLRYSESANDTSPYELDNILVFDRGEGFSFYPLTKIVGGNQQ